jgi:polysaccharide pyruvyl transferase WcaK-like protein
MLSYFNPFRKKVGYFGWTGRGNLGDEALFTTIRKLLRPVALVKFHKFYRKGKFLEAAQETMLSGFMMGAGTLINSRGLLPIMKHFLEKRVPTFVFGAGVLDPEFYCQFPKYPNDMSEWVEYLESCKSVSVRGPLSAKSLADYGYKDVRIVGDPVLSCAADVMPIPKRSNIIGINFGTTRDGSYLWGRSDENVIRFVIQLADILIGRGLEVHFFPVWKNDVSTVLSATKRVKSDVKIWPHSQNILDYLKAMEEVDVFIGEKLHSVIGALCAYKPSIMLAYQSKCLDFMKSVGLDDYTIRTDRLDLEQVLFKIDTIWESYETYRNSLFKEISKLKQIQKQIANEIVEFINE